MVYQNAKGKNINAKENKEKHFETVFRVFWGVCHATFLNPFFFQFLHQLFGFFGEFFGGFNNNI